MSEDVLLFVPNPNFQNGQKISKWKCHTLMVQFIEFFDECMSFLGNMRVPGLVIKLQFHVFFYDIFQAVFSSGHDDAVVDNDWDLYVEEEFNAEGKLFYTPHPFWILIEYWPNNLQF